MVVSYWLFVVGIRLTLVFSCSFNYTANGVEGLIKNKKVYQAIATGGVYSEGIMKDFDFTESYLNAALGFIGINDITTFRIEGTAIPELKNVALPNAMKLVENANFKSTAQQLY